MDKSFGLRVPPGIDAMQWPLWDSATLTTTSITELAMFKVPVGQSSKTKLDTNMSASGVVVEGEYYDLYSIGAGFRNNQTTGLTQAELRKVIGGGYISIVIQDREVFAAPLIILPLGGGDNVMMGAATDVCLNSGMAASNARYFFKRMIRLYKNIPFTVYARWPAGIATAANQSFMVWIDGLMYRRKV